LYNKALDAMAQDRWVEALTNIDRAVAASRPEEHTTAHRARFLKVRILLTMGRLEAAQESLREALAPYLLAGLNMSIYGNN